MALMTLHYPQIEIQTTSNTAKAFPGPGMAHLPIVPPLHTHDSVNWRVLLETSVQYICTCCSSNPPPHSSITLSVHLLLTTQA